MSQSTEVMAISADNAEDLQKMVDRVAEEHDGYRIDYTMLTDEDAAIIRRYGIYNENSPEGRPLPHPTVYVIDREGVVHWKFTEVDYRVRPENADILAALAEIG